MNWLPIIVSAVIAPLAFIFGIRTSRWIRRRREASAPHFDDMPVGTVFRDGGYGRWLVDFPTDPETGRMRHGEIRAKWIEKP